MRDDDLRLAGLLCAKVCHDLVSPVGAIGNGLEILRPDAPPDPEEYALLVDAARDATATLRFLRLAFGVGASEAETLSMREVRSVVDGRLARERHVFSWPDGDGEIARPAARMLMLSVLTAAAATPRGAEVVVAPVRTDPLHLRVEATGPTTRLPPDAGRLLADPGAVPPTAREAQYALLARLAEAEGARAAVAADDSRVTITISA